MTVATVAPIFSLYQGVFSRILHSTVIRPRVNILSRAVVVSDIEVKAGNSCIIVFLENSTINILEKFYRIFSLTENKACSNLYNCY